MESNVVLTMRGITMTFPGVKALDHVDLTLRKGEIMALMGENGAGKSTLIKCLTGINAFEAGEIHVEGIDGPVVNHSTLDAQKKGISTVYQEVNLCPNLSVAENLFIGREPKTKLGTIDWKTMVAKSEKIMDSLDIKIDEFESGKDFISLGINLAKYDIVFLDVNMDELDGMETAQKIRKVSNDVFIVFVTAFITCAPQGYSVGAIRYILKNNVNFPELIFECMDASYYLIQDIQMQGR